MVQILGNGVDINEVRLVLLSLIVISGILNILTYQSTEGIPAVIDKRVFGYPDCTTRLDAGANQTIASFCIAPSETELKTVYSQLTLSAFPDTTGDPALLMLNLAYLIFGLLGALVVIVKLFATINFIIYFVQFFAFILPLFR